MWNSDYLLMLFTSYYNDTSLQAVEELWITINQTNCIFVPFGLGPGPLGLGREVNNENNFGLRMNYARPSLLFFFYLAHRTS